jgi:hypothetical protein
MLPTIKFLQTTDIKGFLGEWQWCLKEIRHFFVTLPIKTFYNHHFGVIFCDAIVIFL